MTIDLSERLELARHLAHEARKIILKHYSPAGVRFETKADGSPVTIADRSAEEFMRRELAKRCPQDAILGEEMGETPGAGGSGSGEVRWVLDPIDGTRAFTHGIPLFGCMVALEWRLPPAPTGGIKGGLAPRSPASWTFPRSMNRATPTSAKGAGT